jgi:hypothetical protein
MHHVLTFPRALRRHDGEEAAWIPVTVPHADTIDDAEVQAAAVTRTTRRIDGLGIASVAKLALVFYGCVFACLSGGVLVLWTAIATMGYVDRFERFMRSIGFRGFAVSSDNIVFGLIGVAGSLTLLATLLTVTVALAYNVVGSTGHGLVLRISDPAERSAQRAPVEDEAPHAA